uniref:Uncharacterized protein n=1 Tax=Medicago truncatula TaxID=3880 RepID=A4PSD5_MEDTR|nr:hypothetical protein MtrDRAFT_AC140549g74v2 [Medicago truncatula]
MAVRWKKDTTYLSSPSILIGEVSLSTRDLLPPLVLLCDLFQPTRFRYNNCCLTAIVSSQSTTVFFPQSLYS